MISISQPAIDAHTEDRVLQVLRSGRLAAGPSVEELEDHFRKVTGTASAIAVSSGTAALESVLETVVRPGDAVVTTPFTFVATLNAVLRAGAEVRFVDVGEDFNLDPAKLEEAIDERTAVVLPVHLYGRPCDMPRISDVANRHDLLILEDAAQAVGASIAGRAVGSWGVGCFSLYATKNVAAGEGGVITTDNDALARHIRTFINQGSTERYEYEMVGTNRRMSELHAAIALPQIEALNSLTQRRRHNASLLSAGLRDLPGVIIPEDSPGHVYHQYTIRITKDGPIDRESFQAAMRRAGIETGIYYPRLVHDYACFSDHPLVNSGRTPRARQIATEVVSLPVHPGLTDGDIDRVIEATRTAFRA